MTAVTPSTAPVTGNAVCCNAGLSARVPKEMAVTLCGTSE